MLISEQVYLQHHKLTFVIATKKLEIQVLKFIADNSADEKKR